jgi:hypothetical protein
MKRCVTVGLPGLLLALLAARLVLAEPAPPPAPDRGLAWKRHTIDDSSRGADGVRLADVNGDGLLDVATGWEQGGQVRVYLHPGRDRARGKWPAVTVGAVGRPEDAVFVDLDGDGATDVVSCCEGSVRGAFVHWAPKDPGRYLDPAAWKTEAFPALRGAALWMFCLPLQVDGRHGTDLILGSKGRQAKVGWLEAPAAPRDLAAWKWHPLSDAGWVMSLVAFDVDGDGDPDVVASDWEGKHRGCYWLENPGPKDAAAGAWPAHRIGAANYEAMFLDLADLDRDGRQDVVVTARDKGLVYHRRTADRPPAWESFPIALAPNTGLAKSVRAGDIDLDGKPDLVYACAAASGDKSGVVWLSYREAVTDPVWDAHEVSGPAGTKFDLVQLIDLDGDGDLDILTCEERENLSVFWYENPTKP